MFTLFGTYHSVTTFLFSARCLGIILIAGRSRTVDKPIVGVLPVLCNESNRPCRVFSNCGCQCSVFSELGHIFTGCLRASYLSDVRLVKPVARLLEATFGGLHSVQAERRSRIDEVEAI